MSRVESMRPGPSPIDVSRLYVGRLLQKQLSINHSLEESVQAKENDRFLEGGLTSEELATIAAVVTFSGPTSYKARKLAEGLSARTGGVNGGPPLVFLPEIIEESDYNRREVFGRRAKYIAAVKAFGGRGYPDMNKEGRFHAIRSEIKTNAGDGVALNELGTVYFLRAHDVVTAFVDSEGHEHPLLKPTTQNKREVMRDVLELFGKGKTRVQYDFRAAEAIYEPVYQVGVVREDVAHLDMCSPSEEFLECLFFGVQHVRDDAPEKLKKMAARFLQIYQKAIQDHQLREWLRGWTPELGMENIHKVNGGLHIDSIFAMEMLVNSISFNLDERVHARGSLEFIEAQQRAIAIVRGEPVSFHLVARAVLDIIRRKTSGESVPDAHKKSRFVEISADLASYLGSERAFGGKWYDISDNTGVYPVDAQEYRGILAALLADPGMLQ